MGETIERPIGIFHMAHEIDESIRDVRAPLHIIATI